MLRVSQVRAKQRAEPYLVEATAWGEKLDPARHHPRVDVKAITLHNFRLERSDRGWEARVILVFPLPWPVMTTTNPFFSFGVNRVISTTASPWFQKIAKAFRL